MKQILTVFVYTFRDAARKKAFVVTTAVILALVLILCALPRVIALFDGTSGDTASSGEASTPETAPGQENPGEGQDAPDPRSICYYIDDAGLIPGGADVLAAALSATSVEPATREQLDELRAVVAEDSHCSIVLVNGNDAGIEDELPFLTVITRDFMSTPLNASYVAEVLSESYVRAKLSAQGIGDDVISLARTALPYSSEIAGTLDLSGYVLGIVVTMLVFFAIYYYGYGVSMSVATEKTSRVMETLIVSAKPSRILIGKCLAMGALGLCQYAGVLVFAAVCYKLLIPADFLLMGMPLSLSAFTPLSALLMLVYFILGYALYVMLNAVCGAMVSKIEDLQSALMPVMLLEMFAFYIAYFTAISGSGEGLFQKIAMYIPFCSPFIMPFKLLNSDVSAASIVISILALLATIVIVSVICIRIYSASVLHYGKRLKWKDAYRTKV